MSPKDVLRIRALDVTRHAIVRAINDHRMKTNPPPPHPMQMIMDRLQADALREEASRPKESPFLQ